MHSHQAANWFAGTHDSYDTLHMIRSYGQCFTRLNLLAKQRIQSDCHDNEHGHEHINAPTCLLG